MLLQCNFYGGIDMIEESSKIEEWKDIPSFEGLYQASSFGRIKAVERTIHYSNGKVVHRKEKILSLIKGYGKYLTVGLNKNGKHKIYNVHRLIAKTFIENPNNYPCVNHKDENKHNNHADNLEWCTQSYNIKYNNAMRRRVDTRNKNNSYGSEKKVYQYDLHGNLIKVWDSLISINKELKHKNSNINSCCLNKKYRHTAYGYKWSYKPL